MILRPIHFTNAIPKAILLTGALLILLGCVAGGARVTYAPSSQVPPAPITLQSVNAEWIGAVAQVRYPFKIGKGKNSAGWSESKWAKFPEDDSEVQLSVSDRDALREIIPKKRILTGARLVCDGWSLRRPSKGKDLQVDFHFENYPSQARIIFEDKDLEDLPEAERFLRLKILKLYAKSEQLTRVVAPAAPAARATPAAPPARPSQPPSAQEPYKPSVEILSASVQPARVRAGEQVDLIVTYRVQGIPQGTVFEATEVRTLFSGDTALATFKDPINRSIGTFTSTKKVKVPASTSPGVYRFRVHVTFAGSESESEAIFEVH